jgi:hypothetical protein
VATPSARAARAGRLHPAVDRQRGDRHEMVGAQPVQKAEDERRREQDHDLNRSGKPRER